MNVLPSLRLKPLAACLAAALAIVPVAALLADRAEATMRQPPPADAPRRSFAAQWLAASEPRRGTSLKEVMEKAAAKARALGPAPPQRPAGTIPVTSCDDSGPGTLRDAVANAVSDDVIDLSQLSCSTISLTTGAMSVLVTDLTIQGPGRDALTIDAARASGIFAHYGAGTLTIDGLTLTNGYIVGYAYHGGACVLSNANVAISNSTLTNCYSYTAHAYGGAVCAVGNITLSNATLSNNTAKGHFYYYYYPGYPNPYLFNGTAWGGGAYAGGRFTITYSTITHNRAPYNNRGSVGGGFAGRVGGSVISGSTIDNNYAWLGGGFMILAHPDETAGLTVVNSTISGNDAAISSGGFNAYRMTYLTLHNSTVTDNFAPYCGGVYAYYGVVDIKSSIIGGNTSIHSLNQFGYYTAADLDSFFGYATVTGDHDVIMTSNAPVPADTLIDDPLLLPLADNGGPTLTHAFDMTSVALDAGSNPNNIAFDQRGDGYLRVLGAAADIGAFEAPGDMPDAIFSDGFD
jgi:hypothetical protein